MGGHRGAWLALYLSILSSLLLALMTTVVLATTKHLAVGPQTVAS